MQAVLRVFFALLYHPLAWGYDAVAWLVSLGRWRSWVNTALVELPPAGRILELGHGPGHLQVAMRIAGYRPFGLDTSAQMGRLAYRRLQASEHTPTAHTPPRLVRADGRRLPFATGSFAGVVATFPTEYIFEDSTLAEARRLLPAGGRLVLLPLAWITGDSLLERAAAWLFRITGEAGEWPPHFSQRFAAAGFAVQEKRVALRGSRVLLLVCEAQ